jgi:hypothetical protein
MQGLIFGISSEVKNEINDFQPGENRATGFQGVLACQILNSIIQRSRIYAAAFMQEIKSELSYGQSSYSSFNYWRTIVTANARDHRIQTTPATNKYTPKFRCIALVMLARSTINYIPISEL